MPADPPSMSLAEKLACEWEARHDVAARKRIGDFAPVQHYLTHARCEDGRNPSTGAGHRATRKEATAESATGVPSTLRSWLRWGEEGGPEHPVIPRC
jgi:hypothetical protein